MWLLVTCNKQFPDVLCLTVMVTVLCCLLLVHVVRYITSPDPCYSSNSCYHYIISVSLLSLHASSRIATDYSNKAIKHSDRTVTFSAVNLKVNIILSINIILLPACQGSLTNYSVASVSNRNTYLV